MSDQELSVERGDQSLEKASESRRAETPPRMAGIIKFLERVSSGEIPRYEHSRIFVFPFLVGEERLMKIDSVVREELSRILPLQDTEFGSETRFKDLSTLRFDTFEHFLSKAGDRNNLESVALQWRKIAVDLTGVIGSGASAAHLRHRAKDTGREIGDWRCSFGNGNFVHFGI